MKTLRQFLSELAVNPQKMEEYLRDADSAMAAAGLSKRDKAVLKSASAATFNTAVANQPQASTPSFSFVHGNSIISIYVVISPIEAAPAALETGFLRPPPAIIRPATVNVVRPPVVRVPVVRPPSNGNKKRR